MTPTQTHTHTHTQSQYKKKVKRKKARVDKCSTIAGIILPRRDYLRRRYTMFQLQLRNLCTRT